MKPLGKTLVVDDSRFIREYLLQQLRGFGTFCQEAGDGLEALEVLRESGAGFDLMLLDINMPRMSGLECVRLLRTEGLWPEMKVMMVTTEADHSFIRQALACGADEFLMKPFTPESLREKLRLLGLRTAA